MVTLLAKWLIKDTDSDARVRELYGSICGGLGIFLNIVLCIGKMIAGVLSGSIAITADALNNLSDAGSSIVTIIGFKLASQKPDRKHPYGHGRIEYIAGLIVSGIIIIMGYQLMRDAFMKILHPDETEFNLVIAGILIASILVKCYMAFYNAKVGKKIDSATILAISKDSLSDCLATFVVLLSGIIAHFFDVQIDGYAGIIVGLFVLKAGYEAMKETINPLLGLVPEQEYLDAIEAFVNNYDEKVVGVHDMIVHDYGPGRQFISLHAEVPAEGDILELHDMIDVIEHELGMKFNCLATIHMDPVITKDPRVTELKEQVIAIALKIDERLKVHDFRVVFGTTHNNLIYDVVIPYDVERSDEEITSELFLTIQKEIGQEYLSVINVDKM